LEHIRVVRSPQFGPQFGASGSAANAGSQSFTAGGGGGYPGFGGFSGSGSSANAASQSFTAGSGGYPGGFGGSGSSANAGSQSFTQVRHIIINPKWNIYFIFFYRVVVVVLDTQVDSVAVAQQLMLVPNHSVSEGNWKIQNAKLF